MEIILIIFLLLLVIIVLFFLFTIFKWIFRKKVRIIGVLILLMTIGTGITINKLFFIKMEFIQSKVYPDLYIIKNPSEDENVLQKAIKTIVSEKTKHQIDSNFLKNSKKNSIHSIGDVAYHINFYEYTKGSFFMPFNDAGTYYFIEHEEDPGGFSVEVLDMYSNYHIAEFNLKFCENDTLNYYGTINFYKNREITKTDTILNYCKK
ncbi:hypothetical protein [uncultured Aquimarina sp.]|uniref:hypothetical protein n=1 Tax=uncultured Aquimarina sp. TaxID=575652 RepID=UPI00262CECC9|nr:hypothetical protein [uncultured Aquimarina sp.]